MQNTKPTPTIPFPATLSVVLCCRSLPGPHAHGSGKGLGGSHQQTQVTHPTREQPFDAAPLCLAPSPHRMSSLLALNQSMK